MLFSSLDKIFTYQNVCIFIYAYMYAHVVIFSFPPFTLNSHETSSWFLLMEAAFSVVQKFLILNKIILNDFYRLFTVVLKSTLELPQLRFTQSQHRIVVRMHSSYLTFLRFNVLFYKIDLL